MAKIISSSEFESEVLKSTQTVLVDFFAEWCGPCKMLAPVLEQFSEEMNGEVKVVKVDVDKAPDLSSEHGIVSVPTLVLYKDGQIAKKISGLQSLDQLKSFVK